MTAPAPLTAELPEIIAAALADGISAEMLLAQPVDLIAVIRYLLQEFSRQQSTNRQLLHENGQLKLLVEKLVFEIAQLKRQMFGRKREALDAVHSDLFDPVALAELGNPPKLPEAVVQAISSPNATDRQTARRVPIPADLPREVIVVDLPEAEKIIDGVALVRIGEDVREQLQYAPGVFSVLRTVRPKYVLPQQPDAGIRVAPAPLTVIDGGVLADSTIAHVAVSKYCDHLPLNRQVEAFARQGVNLAVSTLSETLLTVALVWLKPLVRALWQRLRSSTALHVDETTLPTLAKGETRKTRIWTYLGRIADDGPPVILYHYTLDKCGQHVRDVLGQWPQQRTVYLHADAANNYDELYKQFPHIREVGCWAHARRKFFDIVKSSSTPIFAHGAVEWIDQLFAIERQFRDGPLAGDIDRRRQNAGKVLEYIRTEFTKKRVGLQPKSPTAKAIRYVQNHWIALTRYLEQPHLRPDNNAAERALRKAAVGRKNWLFAGSERGGEAAAIYYSLLETAKANGLNPFTWLTHALAELPKRPGSTFAHIHDLLPLPKPSAQQPD